jgi:hypothetical protein
MNKENVACLLVIDVNPQPTHHPHQSLPDARNAVPRSHALASNIQDTALSGCLVSRAVSGVAILTLGGCVGQRWKVAELGLMELMIEKYVPHDQN